SCCRDGTRRGNRGTDRVGIRLLHEVATGAIPGPGRAGTARALHPGLRLAAQLALMAATIFASAALDWASLGSSIPMTTSVEPIDRSTRHSSASTLQLPAALVAPGTVIEVNAP